MCDCLSSVASGIATVIITVDKICDFIPIVSAFNNTIDIIAKIALSILKCICPPAYEFIKNCSITVHLEKKNTCVCIGLAIPIFNFFFAIAYHLSDSEPATNPANSGTQNYKTDPAPRPSPTNKQPVSESTRKYIEEEQERAVLSKQLQEKHTAEIALKARQSFPEGSSQRDNVEKILASWDRLTESHQQARNDVVDSILIK